MKRISITAAMLVGSAAFSSFAFADPFTAPSGNIGVSLTIVDQCTITTPTLSFGTHGVLETELTTSGTITVECTKGTPYAIALDAGQGGDGTVAHRAMSDGGSNAISYQLYSDADSAVWGDDFGNTTVGNAAATGDAEPHTVYAKVPVQTSAPVGTYSDTVLATIWYGAANVGGPPN